MSTGDIQFTDQELDNIKNAICKELPKEVEFSYFVGRRQLAPLSEIAKKFGFHTHQVKEYADKKPHRYKEMGLHFIGKKLYANMKIFTDWALQSDTMRRKIVYNFSKTIVPLRKGSDLSEIIKSDAHYLLDDLCAANLIAEPLSDANGKGTLIQFTKAADNPREEMGLWFDDEFKAWIVSPARFFKFLGNKLQILEEA